MERRLSLLVIAILFLTLHIACRADSLHEHGSFRAGHRRLLEEGGDNTGDNTPNPVEEPKWDSHKEADAPRQEQMPDPPKEEQKWEAPKEEQKSEPPKEEQKWEAPKEEQKSEPPKEEQKWEAPKEEQKSEPPKEEQKWEAPKEEQKSEPPKEEQKWEAPKGEQKPEPPKEEPPKEEQKWEAPKEEQKWEAPKEEQKPEPPKEEQKWEAPKEEPPKEEQKWEAPKEEQKPEPPKEEQKWETPKEEPPKEEQKWEAPKEQPKTRQTDRSKIEELKSELDSVYEELEKERTERKEKSSTLDSVANEKNRIQSEKDRTEQEKNRAESEKMEMERQKKDLETKLNEVEVQKRELEEKRNKLEEEKRQLEKEKETLLSDKRLVEEEVKIVSDALKTTRQALENPDLFDAAEKALRASMSKMSTANEAWSFLNLTVSFFGGRFKGAFANTRSTVAGHLARAGIQMQASLLSEIIACIIFATPVLACTSCILNRGIRITVHHLCVFGNTFFVVLSSLLFILALETPSDQPLDPLLKVSHDLGIYITIAVVYILLLFFQLYGLVRTLGSANQKNFLPGAVSQFGLLALTGGHYFNQVWYWSVRHLEARLKSPFWYLVYCIVFSLSCYLSFRRLSWSQQNELRKVFLSEQSLQPLISVVTDGVGASSSGRKDKDEDEAQSVDEEDKADNKHL